MRHLILVYIVGIVIILIGKQYLRVNNIEAEVIQLILSFILGLFMGALIATIQHIRYLKELDSSIEIAKNEDFKNNSNCLVVETDER